MPDVRISELPAATTPADADLAPLVQSSGASLETRRATVAQLRNAMPNLDTDFWKAVSGQQLVEAPPALSTTDDDLRLRGGQLAAVSRMFGGRAMPAALNSGPAVPVVGVRSLIR